MTWGSKQLAGYRSRLSVRPGETVEFMVHSAEGEPYEADLVRFVHADLSRRGPGLVVDEVRASFQGTHEGIVQELHSGSFLRAELPEVEPVEALTFAAAARPTLHLEREQIVAELSGASSGAIASLRLGGDARLVLRVAGRRLRLDRPIPLHRWSFVGFALDARRGQVSLFQRPQPEGAADGVGALADEARAAAELPSLQCAAITLASGAAASGRPSETWNGRMDSPRLVAQAIAPDAAEALVRSLAPAPGDPSVLGFWDASVEMAGRCIVDLGPHEAHAEIHNLPNRAVRGFRWTGDERDWRKAPAEYGAIHFHDSDVYDMGWPASFSYTVPDDLRSGAYAARLRCGDETEYVTFFVGPPRKPRSRQPKIAFVASTATYLAYSNELIYISGPKMLYDYDVAPLPESRMHVDFPVFGGSQYESHSDGSGIHFASWLRPIWNLNPNGVRVWGFPADTNVLHWLETRGFDYDLITDHDLHEQGAELASRYEVLVSGSHPEYLTSEMYDAWEGHLERGGRVMYLGGNGFYWRVAMAEGWPAATELRRAEDGTRAWVSEPGEYHHAFGGELGGLWRRVGRSPNRLVGVGFSAQGFVKSAPYRRLPAADDPRAEFIMKGVESDTIGDFGLRKHGAAGEELDRYDTALGSPSHALVLARADDPGMQMVLSKEELLMTMPPDSKVWREGAHADLVFFETPSGGAVFSTGSIAWPGSLSHDGFDNDVARMCENVLRRFVDPTPFQMPPATDPEVPSPGARAGTGARIAG